MKIPVIIILVALIGVAMFYPYSYEAIGEDQVKKFTSEEDLKNYLITSSENALFISSYVLPTATTFDAATADRSMISGMTAGEGAAPKASDYSQTNIQVAGVDEADIVKNDGKYIYTVSGNSIVIVDAYPADSASIVSEIELNSTPSQIFVNNNRLAVFSSGYAIYKTVSEPGMDIAMESISRYYDSGTLIDIYDISDRSNPVLIKNFTMDGNYYNSRMIGDYIYMITNQAVYNIQDPIIPLVARCGMGCVDVWYFDVPESSHQFTIIGALNIQNPDELNTEVFLTGYTQNMYVSQDNIYVTYTKRLRVTDFLDRITGAIIPLVPSDVAGKINQIEASALFSNSEKMSAIGRVLEEYNLDLTHEESLNFQKTVTDKMEIVYEQISKEMEKTIIHKISINDGNIEYKMQGDVPGNVLDQFSMDESNGYFRIATTTDTWSGTTSKNHVYILDSNLVVTGKLEDLASGERIHSVRFIGDKGYVVTFRQVDPLFVIDLNPTSPSVLGYLKIPGVSDYLHPYDENHLIGVGRDATDQGIMKGMKLSLFDVSDVENPREVSTYFIGERGTSSEALNEHKAFLFSKEKNLLVIPVNLVEDNKYNAFQGVYVFNLDLENGFDLKGKVTHRNQTAEEEYYYDYAATVRRSLYMDDVLYTISQKMIKMNSLDDISEINSINLPYEYGYPIYYAGGRFVEVLQEVDIDE